MNVVSTDTSCIVCGYCLRTLSREGVCPECGAAVERSFQDDLLRFADQRWLNRVHLGMKITYWSTRILYAAIIIALCGFIPLLAMEFLDWRLFGEVIGGLVFLPCGFTMIVWPPAMAVGLWLISSHEPRGGTGGGVGEFLFRALSAPAMLSISAWVIAMVWARIEGIEPAAFLALQSANVILLAVHAVLLIGFAQQLGRRSASFDQKIADYLRRMRTQVIGCSIVFAVVCLPSDIGRPMTTITPLAVYIFIIIWIAAHSSLEKVMQHVAKEREAAAAAPPLGDPPAAPPPGEPPRPRGG